MDRSSSEQPFLLSLVRWSLLGLLFTPLIFSHPFFHPYVATKGFYITAVTEIALFFYVWLIALYPNWRPRLHKVGICLLVYLGVLFLTSLIGIDFFTSFWGSGERDLSLLVWLHLGIAFILFTSIFRTRKDYQRVFSVSVGVGLVVVILYFFSVIGLPVVVESKSGSTLGNSSFLGTYLLFQIFFALYLALTSEKKMRIFGILSSIVLIITLFSTTAQAAIFSFLGGMVVFGGLFMILRGKTKTIRSIGIGVCSVLVIASLFLGYLSFVQGSSVRRFVDQHTSPARFVTWNIAWHAFQERPVFGWGYEGFRYVFQKYYHPCLGSSRCGLEVWFDRAHNQPLDILVESGVVGFLSFVALLIVAGRILWKSYASGRLSASAFAVWMAFFAAYLVQNLTVFDTATSTLFFLVVLAFISSLLDQPHKEPSSTNLFFLPIIFTILIPLGFFFFVVQPARAYLATKAAALSSQMNHRFSEYQKAVWLSPVGVDYRRAFLSAQTVATVWDQKPELRTNYHAFFERELELSRDGLRTTIKQTPNFLRSYLNLGLINLTQARYFDKKYYEDAEAILQEAITQNPTNPLPLWMMVMVLLDQSKVEQALPLAEKAFALDEDVTNSQLRRIITYLFADNPLLLEEKIGETLLKDPSLAPKIELYRTLYKDGEFDALLFRLYFDATP